MRGRLLVLEAAAGVSGDMFVGALLDLGADLQVVREHLGLLGLSGVDLRASRVERAGVTATRFEVIDPDTGHRVDAMPGAACGAGHPAAHPRHRCMGDIQQLISGSGLPAAVAKASLAVFERLARAEARVHGVSLEQVHFHEVGALDSIADIVAAASAYDQLGVHAAWCSAVHVGCGTVRCQHGVLPVPAPATAELLEGVPVYSTGIEGELCTPTGAALVRHFCKGFGVRPALAVEAVGYGAGSRNLPIPNVLRATLGRGI